MITDIKADEYGWNFKDLMDRADVDADEKEMYNLIKTEQGKNPIVSMPGYPAPSFENQLEAVKAKLDIAFNAFINMPVLADNKSELEALQLLAKQSNSALPLIEIRDKANELTRKVIE